MVRAAAAMVGDAKTAKRQAIARRNLLIVKLLYQAGLRSHELCQLTWGDLSARGDSGQVYVRQVDTLRAKAAEILGSTSPLSLDPLRYLSQRWFSPQALTFLLPGGSCIAASFG
jgi:hypothetical protein